MNPMHKVEDVKFTDDSMFIKIDGKDYTFALSEISRKLSRASKTEREQFRVMASGYGIHWPLLDEDLSIDGLLGITHTPEFRSHRASQKLQVA